MLVIHLFIYLSIYFLFLFIIIFFLNAMYQARMYSLCFFKKSGGLYFISANWLFLILVIDP